MPDFATGGPIDGPINIEPSPCRYYMPGYVGIKPGVDWFIDGHRYRETARTQLDNGHRTTLELADAEPALGFTALKES